MSYEQLVEFCGDERKAYFLARHLPYKTMTAAQMR